MFESLYESKLKEKVMNRLRVELLEPLNRTSVHYWGERNKWLDPSKGIVYYPHTLRHGKGHIEFAKQIAAQPSLFENFTFHFSGGKIRDKECWTISKRYLDEAKISYSRVGYTEKNDYLNHLCHHQGVMLVTWSESDANPRVPYDGLFCNLPHFTSFESNVNPTLLPVGVFEHYGTNIASELHDALTHEWGEEPIDFARTNVTYDKMICGLFESYDKVHECC